MRIKEVKQKHACNLGIVECKGDGEASDKHGIDDGLMGET